MKTLSYWARDHRFLSRSSVVILHLLLILNAAYIGISLERLQVEVSPVLAALSILLICVAILFYPSRKENSTQKQIHYLRRKTCDGGMIVAGFLLVLFISNRNDRLANFTSFTSLQGSFISSGDSEKSSEFDKPTKHTNNEIRKQIKELIKVAKNSQADSAGQILAVAGVIMLTIFLFIMLAALSCNISCAGSETLALLVLLAGTTGLVFLCVWAIKRITRKKPAARKPVPVDETHSKAILSK